MRLACAGVAKPIAMRQTATGIKDAYTQQWIEDLLLRAQAEKKENPCQSKAEIQSKLWQWVEDHEDIVYSPFLSLKGILEFLFE